jgi:hypothetical protein
MLARGRRSTCPRIVISQFILRLFYMEWREDHNFETQTPRFRIGSVVDHNLLTEFK